MKLTLNRRLLRLPPIICFIIARRTVGANRRIVALSAEEIAKRSGLPIDRVIAISWMLTWNNVSVTDMLAYSQACDIDFNSCANIKTHDRFMRRHPMFHFKHLIKMRNYPEYRDRIALLKQHLREGRSP